MTNMKAHLRPRSVAFDLYWHFAAERHSIFEKRVKGYPPPWTSDPILSEFKFCNVFRASDRVSQYLIREVAYSAEASEPEDRLFQLVAFRTFSRIETWESVCRFLGRAPTRRNLLDGSFLEALDHAQAENGGLYTGAFILCATRAYGFDAKHRNHVELFRRMFVEGRLGEAILGASSLREVFELLRSYPLMGDFMSYQIAIDLNYSELLPYSENDFTQPGPGAIRGLKKAFESLGDYSPSDAIRWMVDNQEAEIKRLGLTFGGLWGRPLHAIDCQGLFCELDKYCREAVPSLKSARSRIKSRFRPAADPIRLFYPPKWGINSKLPLCEVLGDRTNRAESLQGLLYASA